MSAAWILYVLLVGTLLGLAALAADEMLRRLSLPTRWVWLVALVGMVALSVLAPQSALEETTLRVKITAATVSAEPQAANSSMMSELSRVRRGFESAVTSGLARAEARTSSETLASLGLIWLGLSAAVFSMVAIVSRRVRLARVAWRPMRVHDTPVRVAPEFGPAVIGLVHPEIVVPRWLLERTAEEQRLVIAHERAHVAAGDQLLMIASWIVTALLPWHPAMWWAASRLRLAIELDCDSRVLAQGITARSYGSLLIDIASQCAGQRATAVALADGTSNLERRLLAMKHSKARFTFVRVGALGAFALLAVAGACEARIPTSAEIDKMDVASAEQSGAVRLFSKMHGGDSVLYVIDGKAATAAEAHAIKSSDVMTISLKKAEVPGAKQLVLVKTKGVLTDKLLSAKEEAELKKHIAIESKMMSKHSFDGLVIVDGVRSTIAAVHALSPANIETIDILKGGAGSSEYPDPAAANGVIRVTTKRR